MGLYFCTRKNSNLFFQMVFNFHESNLVFFSSNPNELSSPISKKIIKDFVGLEKSDKKTKESF